MKPGIVGGHATLTAVDVYLVPVSSTRYELYCESAEIGDLEPTAQTERGGIYVRFRRMVAEAQDLRRARRLAAVPADPTVRQSWFVRLRNFAVGRVAEAIVEWRLLWHLRKQSDAALVHPDDLDADGALAEARAGLQRDADHHRRRLVTSAIAAAVLGPLLFFVPGPNLVAYYFWFLAVGHLLAWRGAKCGIAGVKWQTRASAPMVDLRGILDLDPEARATHVRDVEARLKLEHLAAFVERMVVRFR